MENIKVVPNPQSSLFCRGLGVPNFSSPRKNKYTPIGVILYFCVCVCVCVCVCSYVNMHLLRNKASKPSSQHENK